MINLRLVILCLIAILPSLSATAQQTVIWRISGNGLTRPSYLFGAMDFICPGDYLWPKGAADCFAKSDKVCLQVNLNDEALVKKISQAIMNNKGSKLEDYFSPADYARVDRYAQDSLHLNLSKVQMLKPVGVQSFIVKKLLGCTDAVSYDKRVMEFALKANKQILGMETADDLIKEIDETHFNQKVAAVLTEMTNGSNYYYGYRSSIMSAYQQQDLQSINYIFKNTKLFSPGDFTVLLDDKSKRWVSRMPAMMQQASVFFSLNAINLWGEEGVINLLKKAGYTVEPIY